MWRALSVELNIPADLVAIIKNMYIDSKGVLKVSTATTEAIDFLTTKGVK